MMKNSCYDCGVEPGHFHKNGCDVERCPDCGGQYISCDCGKTETDRLKFTGEWPGVLECREFGWYAKFIGGLGWVRCDKDDKDATEDLNRLALHGIWDVENGRYQLPQIT